MASELVAVDPVAAPPVGGEVAPPVGGEVGPAIGGEVGPGTDCARAGEEAKNSTSKTEVRMPSG
jgi:hypothetical protein